MKAFLVSYRQMVIFLSMEFTIVQLILILASALHKNSNESELYLKIKNGDKDAFRSFFEEHHQRLFSFLLSKGISKAEAEDLIQQAFVYIWEHRSEIDEDKSLRSYLFRIAYTRMLNSIRDQKKTDQNAAIPDVESDRSTDDPVHQKELNAAIEKAINSLPEKRQHVFRLCFMQEFTYKEAAEYLDVSVKTIENHMGLALKDLRAGLKKFIS